MQPPLPASNILRITGLCWLVAKLYSYKIWMAYRLLPLVPPFRVLLKVPPVVHSILFVLSCMGLLYIISVPAKRMFLGIFLIIEISACLLDQHRWQPWEFQYICIVYIYFVNYKRMPSTIMQAFIMICACLYFYSGLSKLNPGFLADIWGKMILQQFFHWPQHVILHWPIYYAGYAIAALEALAGLGLLHNTTRKACATALIAMHLFALLWLGPLGLHTNAVVWPWNVLMMAFLYLACLRPQVPVRITAGKHWLYVPNLPIIILFGIMPAFGLANKWDNYLSFSLYSGKLSYLTICINSVDNAQPLRPFANSKTTNGYCGTNASINVYNWAINETGVPPYPELRVYKEIGRQFAQRYPNAQPCCKLACYRNNKWEFTDFNY